MENFECKINEAVASCQQYTDDKVAKLEQATIDNMKHLFEELINIMRVEISAAKV